MLFDEGGSNNEKPAEKKSSRGARLFTIFMPAAAPPQLLIRKRAILSASSSEAMLPSAWPSRMVDPRSPIHLTTSLTTSSRIRGVVSDSSWTDLPIKHPRSYPHRSD